MEGGDVMPVTIKDVAALAGVSPSTVSRTCKDHPSISRQTKEKVRQAMEKLGYEPNFQASSLATQNSRTIGIVLPPSRREAYGGHPRHQPVLQSEAVYEYGDHRTG